ncbi:MAG: hypothetical protein QNK37_18285 [Acidobacteriota bacterium]|nr:hypothetical protein [Acidobacteriota bacterium]
MITALLLALYFQDQPLTRITYDVVLVMDTRLVQLKMVVNKLDDSRFSVSSRKSPGGTLFTWWATPERNVLSFPRNKMVFEGRAQEHFRLFPDGPALAGDQWLQLLEDRPPDDIGSFVYQQVDDWKMIGSREEKVTIRWREQQRRVKERYRPIVLQPGYPESFKVSPLAEMALHWRKHEIPD